MKKSIVYFYAFIWLLLPLATAAQDATALYNEGVKLKKEGKIKDAVAKFKEAISLKPGYTEALYESGWCYNDLKEYSNAITALRKARPGWPDVAKLHFELGYAFDKSEQRDSAVASYNRCLAINPDYSLAHKQMGYLAYADEDYVTALDRFAKYEAVAKVTINDYLYWYRKGFSYNAGKEYAKAIEPLEKSKSLKSDYLNTYLELGFALARLKKSDEAISQYKKAMTVDPTSYVPYNGIGEIYRDNIKDMNESMSWYRRALEIKSNERKANFGIGYCLNSLGRYQEAMPYLKSAIEAESTYTAAYVELGYSEYMTRNNTDAITHLNKAISLSPKNENARYYLGLIYVQQRNKTMAQRMVNELKELSSKNAAALQSKVDAL
jgi:tetratricopeptide (TPR) repeat protein